MGAAVGTGGSVFTTWLNSNLNKDKSEPLYNKAAMNLLEQMLESGDQWQDVREMSNVVGLNESDIKEYLIMLGARGNEKNSNKWGLLTRNPFPQRR